MQIRIGDSQVDVRVEAVLSMPRLAFTANAFSWVQALMPLNIRPTMGTGCFWDQVHTRVWEGFIDRCEYLLCIDYDSFFSQADIEHLFALALTFQCDALAPLQTKREDGRPMLTLKGQLDNPPAEGKTSVPREWFAAPVQEVDTAHFGCTIISTAALKRCEKPYLVLGKLPQERQQRLCHAAGDNRPRRVRRDLARQGFGQAGVPVDD
jgi:hypothetical protein